MAATAEKDDRTSFMVYEIAIVGSGPAGLSAASRAKALKASHILLEAEDHPSDTIYKYQKGKHVMAEPAVLPLQSGMDFKVGKREEVLGTWDKQLKDQGINIVYKSRVSNLKRGDDGMFYLNCENGQAYVARHVILAIGLQGNIRKLGVSGENHPNIQYTVSDPDEYEGETIVVVGAGDAAIENAVALSKQNRVILINRRDEFATAKDGNVALIMAAAKDGSVEVRYGTETVKVEETSNPQQPLCYVAKTPEGEERIPCNRIIARLGASPPRKQVESFGVVFPSKDANAVPALSETYESNVPGLYIVGALGGYPLIKQAMNQGHEVVDTIKGLPVVPADEPLLKAKFTNFMKDRPLAEALGTIQKNVPLFASLTKLQMREFMLDSSILTPVAGGFLFKKNDYTNTLMAIVSGYVEVEVTDKLGAVKWIRLSQGQYFGEMGLISGRRRTATVRAGEGCVLVETPRKSMLKLMSSVDAVRRQVDEAFLRRAITTYVAPTLSADAVTELMSGGVEVRKYSSNEVIFREGDPADGLYLIRRGSVTVSKSFGGRDVVLSYVSAGNYVGEMALLNDAPRGATVQAAVQVEILILKADAFKSVLARNPQWRADMEARLIKFTKQNIQREQQAGGDSGIIRFLLGQGLGEATDVLLIDESLCVQCNNCEIACAETHDGTSRLKRAAGPSFENIHIPTSCRHCEHPHCMKDCPPDAIRRSEAGEVFISDACIGCGNCERNCPYGVIQMAYPSTSKGKPSLLSWLAFGLGPGPGQTDDEHDHNQPKKAVKCDMCKGQKGGAACVRACPTGAAMRVSPEHFLDFAKED